MCTLDTISERILIVKLVVRVQGFHQILEKFLEIDKDHRQSQDESMNETNDERSM